MPRGLGVVQQKVLLLLSGGFALGLSGSPRKYFRILRMIGKEWENINRATLWRAIRSLYQSKLVAVEKQKDGSLQLVLSEKGKRRSIIFDMDRMRIKVPPRWDGKWRIVSFDIPEDHKKLRDTLRQKLRQLGFLEFQKSIFIHPYPCDDEIDFLIEYYDARQYVRKIVAETIDNALHIKQRFGLHS